jgi:hypothetical protein
MLRISVIQGEEVEGFLAKKHCSVRFYVKGIIGIWNKNHIWKEDLS